jgi:predicted ATPase
MNSVFLTRVALKNFKSIEKCNVELQDLTCLVGLNGSGKSNFVDALRFVRDALRNSLEFALRERHGLNEVRRRSSGHPTHFGIRLDFSLRDGTKGHYSFQVGAPSGGTTEIKQEQCFLDFGSRRTPLSFTVRLGEVSGSDKARVWPPAQKDRLYLGNASGLPEFRPVFDALASMAFYNVNPNELRMPKASEDDAILESAGKNLPSVLARIETEAPANKKLIEEYLAKITNTVDSVQRIPVGPFETLQFRQSVAGAKHSWRFYASSMSDGTLRALGVLVALFQTSERHPVSFIAIEEPETALHPGAAVILREALQRAADSVQIVITSHSPDLLDDRQFPPESILAVSETDGITTVSPIDQGSIEALRKNLYTVGELLRINQLAADVELFEKQTTGTQMALLFDHVQAQP